jgi:hypothetical protein
MNNNKPWFWKVEIDSGGGQYDPTYYKIVDGNGTKVAYTNDQKVLQKVCDEHNQTCMDILLSKGE